MLAVRGPRGAGLAKAADHRDLRAPPGEPPRLRARRGLRNIHRVAEIRLDDKFGHGRSSATRSGTGPSGWRRHSDPGYRRARRADGHLPDRRAPRLRRAAGALDARRVRLRRGGDRRGRQRRRRLPRHRSRREAPAHRQPLRHRAQRRQVRRPARHPRADGLRARAAPRRPAPAVRLRGGRLRRGGRPALQGDLPRLGRAGRPLRPGLARPGRRRRRHDARGDASTPACRIDDIAALRATRRATSASSRCTSSRGRC